MSEIVTIYTIDCFSAPEPDREEKSCSLLPWEGDSPDRRGRDDGGREYVLPKGYTLIREKTNGSPAVLNEDGHPCSLMLHNGCPLLIDRENRMAYLLDPVKKIATYRHLAGLSRADVARKLGVSQKEVFEWENLEKEPDQKTLSKLASLFGCKISDFR